MNAPAVWTDRKQFLQWCRAHGVIAFGRGTRECIVARALSELMQEPWVCGMTFAWPQNRFITMRLPEWMPGLIDDFIFRRLPEFEKVSFRGQILRWWHRKEWNSARREVWAPASATKARATSPRILVEETPTVQEISR